MIELLVAATFAAAVLVFLAPDRHAARLATLSSLVPLAGIGVAWARFDAGGNALTGGDIAFETQTAWFELGRYTIHWHVGVDGVSLPLLALTAVLVTVALVTAWTPIDENESAFYGLVLLLEAALLGVFTALDVLLWLVFWELVLVPVYLLVAGWGGPRRRYAAAKFLVYTHLGTLVLVVGLFVLVLGLGDSLTTLSMPEMTRALLDGGLDTVELGVGPWSVELAPARLELVAFLLLFVGVAVKVPVVPFHTWLPDAHVEAPTPVSVLLAGVLLKMGAYALVRFNVTMLPGVTADLAGPLAVLGVVSVLYGAALALAQTDLKRVVAYSSISSMGYVLVGLVAFTPHGVGGATFQLVSHGLVSALLFAAVGVVYRATHTRMVDDLSGLADPLPRTAWLLVGGVLAYLGLPLTSGFAAELLVFLGAFGSRTIPAAPLVTAVAMFGIVLVAGYLLRAIQHTLFGPLRVATHADVERPPAHDLAPIAVLLALVVLLGVNPDLVYETIQDGVAPLAEAALVGGGYR